MKNKILGIASSIHGKQDRKRLIAN